MKAVKTNTTATPAKSNVPFFSKEGGNSLFSQKTGDKFFNKSNRHIPIVQKKLTVGKPNDKHEQEADSIADKVVQRLSNSKHVESDATQINKIQRAPSSFISPNIVQAKCAECEKEEKLQKKEEDDSMEAGEMLQKKPIFESNAPPDDEKNIRRKCAECEKKEKLQKKSDKHSSKTSSTDIESNLNASKGSGSPLPQHTREQMESSFGTDFSGVRIHNNSSSAQMSKDLNAHAFTHGNDIYFNSGKYDAGSESGKHLLAHELTHTIQQGANKNGANGASKARSKNIQRNFIGDAWDATTDFASDVGDSIVSGAESVGSAVVSGAEYVGEKAWGGVKAVGGFIYDVGSKAIRFLIDEVAPGLLDFLGDVVGFIKDKIVDGIDYLTGGLFSKIESNGLAATLMDLLGAGFSAIGTGVSEGCTAIANVARKLYAFVKKLAGPAFQAFKTLMQKIGSFFSWLWDDLAKPAWDAIKKYGGKVLDWILDKATWLWDLIEPIRNGIARAWNWIMEQFGIAWSEAGSVIDWIKKKAAAAWDWVKEKIQPIIGPLKVIGAILLMLSPVGPILAIRYGAPYVWDAIKWLAENFNKHVIIKAKDYFYNQILPALKNGLNFIQSLIGNAMTWLYNGFITLGSSIKSLLNTLSNFVLFRVIGSGIRRIASGIQSGINYVANKALAFGKWVSNTAARVWNFLEPVREILRNLLLMAVLGPFSILDDGVWSMLESIVKFSLKVPCIRELEGLLQVPFWMEKISKVRQTIKDLWFMINHPDVLEAKAKDFLGSYIKDIAGKSESVLRNALEVVGLAKSKHISGILKYLKPAITGLLANWWPEVKKMLWYLIWPFAEGSPLYKEAPKLWNIIPQIWGNFWSGNFRMAYDGFLEWMQALNNVLGLFSGWIVVGGALVGAIVGAFAGGVGALPGAGAGFEIGLEIGEGIMLSMIDTEALVLREAVLDLLSITDDGISSPLPPSQNENANVPATSTDQNKANGPRQYSSNDVHTGHDRIEYAYQRIANSSLTLGIMGALAILGAVGGQIAKALMGVVEGLGDFIAETLPGVADFVSDVGDAFNDSKLGKAFNKARSEFNAGRKMVRGEVPTPEKPVIDEEGRSIVDADESIDGKRKVETTKEGECLICSSPCEEIYDKYKTEIDNNEGIKKRLDDIKNSSESIETKAEQYKQIEQELAEIKKSNSPTDEIPNIKRSGELKVGEEISVPYGKGRSVRAKIVEVKDGYVKFEYTTKLGGKNEALWRQMKVDAFEKWLEEGDAIRWSAERERLMANRPPYEDGLVDEVWETAKANSEDGIVRDPNPPYEELDWDNSRGRQDQWHMGHKPGKEYAKLVDEYVNDKITYEEFIKEYNNPDNYRPEHPVKNSSHEFEQK